MKQNNKKFKIVIGISVLAIILVSILGTYAYFLISVNNDDKQKVELNAGTMIMSFSDNDTGINGTLNHGESISKKLKIENKGTLDTYASIYFDKLINTYTKGSYSYDLEYSDTEEGTYTKIVSDRVIPTSKVEISTDLAENLLIPAGKTYYYNVIIKLNYLEDVNQNADFSGIFKTQFTFRQSGKKLSSSEVLSLLNYKVTSGDINYDDTSYEITDGSREGAKNSYTVPAGDKDKYILYADSYTCDESTQKCSLVNTNIGKYSEVYTSLAGKYAVYINPYDENTVRDTTKFPVTNLSLVRIHFIESATLDSSTNTGDIKYYNLYYGSNYVPETKVYKINDDYGDSYILRGAHTDNYVKFANKYWRILRINGDGTIRLMYDGTSAHINEDSAIDRTIGDSRYSTDSINIIEHFVLIDSYYNNHTLGYKHGLSTATDLETAQNNSTDSAIKINLDNWYKENLLVYNSAIADSIFCNDRGITEGLGYGSNSTTYKAVDRITNKTPQLTCTQKNDRFTVSDDLGNTDLDYPIGLITADEYMLANSGNYYSYTYRHSAYWTMTPSKGDNYSRVYLAYKTDLLDPTLYKCNGDLDSYSVPSRGNGIYNEMATVEAWPCSFQTFPPHVGLTQKVVPVINIKTDYIRNMTGSGTMNDPFIIEV